jgi:anti-sigma factor RsiW
MTPCPEPRDLLSAFLDGELDPATRQTIARHLEECARCRADEEGQRQVKRFLAPGAAHAPPVPAGLAARVRTRAFAGAASPARRFGLPRWRPSRRWALAGALAVVVLVLALGLGTVALNLFDRSQAATVAMMSMQDHEMAEQLGNVPHTLPGDVAAVRAQLATTMGMTVSTPAAVPTGYHFAGGRALMLGQTHGAQLAWMAGDNMLSLYQVQDPGGPPPGSWHTVQQGDRTYWMDTGGSDHAVFWRDSGMVYVLVGRLPAAGLLDVAHSVDPT